MAQMRPGRPHDFSKYSLEDTMFEALEQLPDEYYVFHSLKIVTVNDGLLQESEGDFVIFNPEKGVLCIEAKAGRVYCENEEWYYGSGIKMAHGGPYRQAAANKWKLLQYISDKNLDDIKRSCKFIHAVWFPSINQDDLARISFPADGDRRITLTSEALTTPQLYIDRLFSIEVQHGLETDLSAYQIKKLLNNVLCPSFNLVPSLKNEFEFKDKVFNRMLREQVRLLDYLEEQPNAVINGVAGSGKTMIALEKARRCSEFGERVLFLCFNRYLRDFLNDNYKNDNIDFYTLDALACKLCEKNDATKNELKTKLEELYLDGEFPYKHVIIDEGQDFGQEDIEESDVLGTLATIALDEEVGGNFYVFYDKLQLVQGRKIPTYIQDADCRLSLYKNCRNTENIAITSMRPFEHIKRPKLNEGSLKGDSPRLFLCDRGTEKVLLDSILEKYQQEGIEDIVILTCKTERTSALDIQEGVYTYKNRKYKFTTCRKYKGLEADVIILVDIDKTVLMTDAINIFYVGSSRARMNLDMLANLTCEDCNDILVRYGKSAGRRQEKAVAAFLNAKLVRTEV